MSLVNIHRKRCMFWQNVRTHVFKERIS